MNTNLHELRLYSCSFVFQYHPVDLAKQIKRTITLAKLFLLSTKLLKQAKIQIAHRHVLAPRVARSLYTRIEDERGKVIKVVGIGAAHRGGQQSRRLIEEGGVPRLALFHRRESVTDSMENPVFHHQQLLDFIRLLAVMR